MNQRHVALLQSLGQRRQAFGLGCAQRCERVLRALQHVKFDDADVLISAHDSLLFLRAFPQSVEVARLADALLAEIEPQVSRVLAATDDSSAFDDEAVSGIAGTTVTNTWTYELARFLVRRHGNQIASEWNFDDNYRQLGTVLPQVIPLLDDDSYVEADTPYAKWIDAAGGGPENRLRWLISSFEHLPVTPLQRTSLYDSLGVSLRWALGASTASRTLARQPVAKLYVHKSPLLQRKQVSLNSELNSAALPQRKLSHREAQSVIEMARDALAVRYRELQGSTNADPDYAFVADVSRGVQLFIWGLAREWRLPLRAYYAGFTLKNGVPVNYFEAIGLFEWMEVGFNTFYAFRDGETAWIYSKVLHLLNQLAGITCFSVYPYQIGKDNEEAIQSGAFWFYRKLGFRPGRPDLLEITGREEAKLARDPKHRTSPHTLRQLAEGHMFFEIGSRHIGAWDSFSTRSLGLAVQRRIASRFNGNAAEARRHMSSKLAKALGVNISRSEPTEQSAFSDFALALSLVPSIARWSQDEKHSLAAVIHAKAGPNETNYLRLLQQNERLRAAFIQAGSAEDCLR